MSKKKAMQSDNLNDDGIVVEKSDSNLMLDTEKPAVIKAKGQTLSKELNGPKGLEPTRYGDWEAKGRCYDF